MKKYIPILLILAMLMAGCSNSGEKNATPTETALPTVPSESTEPVVQPVIVQQDMTAVALPMTEQTLTAQDGTELFTYQEQSMSLVLPDPDVADKIIIDFFTRQDGYRQAAEDIKAMAETKESEYAYFYSALYSPARIDMNVLSLTGTIISYSGGMHSNYSCIFANYDMVTGDVLTLGSILTHEDKADDLGELVIEAIASVPKETGIWDGYESTIRNRFAGNISDDQAWFFDNNGLSFSFPPYELAPFASGIITVTVPYQKLVGIIEDAFFPVEQANAVGTVNATVFKEANTADFSQIAELVMDENAPMVLLYTDSAVTDVTIEVDWQYTTFSTTALTPGDAIMLQADLDGHTVMLHYRSGEEIVSRYIQYSGGVVNLLEDAPE